MSTIFKEYLESSKLSQTGYLILGEAYESIIKIRVLKRGIEFEYTNGSHLEVVNTLEKYVSVILDCLNDNSNFTELTGKKISNEIKLSYNGTSIWVSKENTSIEEIKKRWLETDYERIQKGKVCYLVGIKNYNNTIRDIQLIKATAEDEARIHYKCSAQDRKLAHDDITIVGIYNEKEDTILLMDYSCYFDIEKLKKQM